MEGLISILHLEDDPVDAELVQATLESASVLCKITRVQSADEFSQALETGGYDLILADYRLPGYDGISALRFVQIQYPHIPFIFVSGTLGEDAAIDGLTQGATDYVLKNKLARLVPAMKRALNEAENRNKRKQAEEELQRTNDLLRAIIEAAPTAIIGLDLDGKVQLIWNTAAEKMLGWSAQEVMGKFLPTVSIDNEKEFSQFRGWIRNGKTLNGVEVKRQKRDGTRVDYSIYGSPLHNPEGQIIGNIAVLADITERKQVENIRQARLRLLEFASLHSLDEFLTATLDEMEALTGSVISFYHFLEPDQKTLRLQTWSTNTVKNMCTAEGKGSHYGVDQAGVWVDCVHERRPVIHNDYASLLHRKGIPDGHTPVIREAVVPIFRGDSIKAIIGIGNKATDYNDADIEIVSQLGDLSWDIAERKRAEEALRESEWRYREVFNNVLDALYLLRVTEDGHFQVLEINPASEKLPGIPRTEIIGKFLEEIIPEEVAAIVNATLHRCVETGQPMEHEEELDLPSGHQFFHSNLIPARDETGRVSRIIGISRNITERKRAEQERKHHELEREAVITVSNALRKAVTSAEILTIILDQLVDLFDADGSMVALPNPVTTGGCIIETGRGAVGNRFTGLNIPPGQGVSAWVIENKQPYLNNHADTDTRFYRPDLLGDAYCIAAVPLIAKERAIGALWVTRRTDLTEQDLRLFNAIADIAANALHRVTLHEQTELQLHHLIALHQIDLAISTNFDLGVTFNVILNNLKDELDVDAASILLLNPVTHTLDYAAGIGFRTAAIEQSRVPLGDGYAGQAVREYQVVSCTNLRQTSETFSRASLLGEENFESHYVAPLIFKGQVKGVLELFHRGMLEPEQEWMNYFETLATQAAIAIESASLFENLQRSNTELMLAYDATIEGWSRALDLRDKETEGHTQRVTEMVLDLAEKMGISDTEKLNLRRGALLHDIGKMGVPDSILLKSGPLSESEWEVMRQHPLYAYQMLSPIMYLKRALDIPYCHHEKWDGSGYPRGLKGEQIPLSARLFAIVDVFDALTHDRPYRAAWSPEAVYRHIQEQTDKHFDPQVAKIFLKTR